MVDKCEIKVPKSRNYLTEWPFVGGLLTGGLVSGWPLVLLNIWPHFPKICEFVCTGAAENGRSRFKVSQKQAGGENEIIAIFFKFGKIRVTLRILKIGSNIF